MGVQARLVLWAPGRGAAVQAASAAFERIAELDQIMSDYRSTSELVGLSAHPAGEPVPVSADLFSVLRKAQEMAAQSGGAFDITVGPLVALWREARRARQLPSDSAVAAARLRVGWQLLRLDQVARTATLARVGMRLDLGGIAKGYACDQALLALRAQGVGRALVELGGDLVVGDPPPGSDGWPIEIETPDRSRSVLRLSRTAVSTSGDSEQFVEIGGKRYSHVIDPRTGQALTSRIAVTVIAPDGASADGLATLVSVLGRQDGEAFLRRYYPEVRVWIR